MNDFDQAIDDGFSEAIDEIGEEFSFRGLPIFGVFSDLTIDRKPEIAGYSESFDGSITVSMAKFQAISQAKIDVSGKRITRKKDGLVFRIAGVTDVGGGLVDLSLESLTESS
jgi:hypothetical protein